MDDVFFDKEQFALLHNEPYVAFVSANKANKAFRNAKELIMGLTHACPLENKALDWTTKARDAAKTAKEAYNHFSKYFSQFTPTIQNMLRSCDECVYVAEADSDTVHLGVDLKVVQDTLDRLNAAIWAACNKLEDHFKKLNDAILKAHKASKQYKASYLQYKKLADDIDNKL